MADNRTQPASPQKLAQARARGDVAVSADWASAAVLAIAVLWGGYGAARCWQALRALAGAAWRGQPPEAALWLALAQPLLLLLIGLPLVALLANLAQVGIGGERTASTRISGAPAGDGPGGTERVQELALSVLKLSLVGALLLTALRSSLPGLLEARPAAEQLHWAGELARALTLRAALALAVIGMLDLVYRRWRRARRLRMTQHELRRDLRESEGDPRLRREWRARSRALQDQATLAELDAASCVIAAAGRAIALRYAPDDMAAPVLWLKASGELSETLLAHASALGLPIEPDATLTQELYRLEPSEPIPASSFERVAAILRRRAATDLLADR